MVWLLKEETEDFVGASPTQCPVAVCGTVYPAVKG